MTPLARARSNCTLVLGDTLVSGKQPRTNSRNSSTLLARRQAIRPCIHTFVQWICTDADAVIDLCALRSEDFT